MLQEWVAGAGLDLSLYDAHSMRRTKATLVYKRTGSPRAVDLPLGHSKIVSAVSHLGTEVDYALSIAENVEV